MALSEMAWPQHDRLMFDTSVTLECDLEVLRTFLDGPANIASWFGAIRRVETDQGRARVALVGSREIFEVTERWLPDEDALHWLARRRPFVLEGYLTMREMLRGVGPRGELLRGVEVWIHVESEQCRRARHLLQVAAHVATSGTENLRAEFGCP